MVVWPSYVHFSTIFNCVPSEFSGMSSPRSGRLFITACVFLRFIFSLTFDVYFFKHRLKRNSARCLLALRYRAIYVNGNFAYTFVSL